MNLSKLKKAVSDAETKDARYVAITLGQLKELAEASRTEDEGILATIATFTPRRGKFQADQVTSVPRVTLAELIAAAETPVPAPAPADEEDTVVDTDTTPPASA